MRGNIGVEHHGGARNTPQLRGKGALTCRNAAGDANDHQRARSFAALASGDVACWSKSHVRGPILRKRRSNRKREPMLFSESARIGRIKQARASSVNGAPARANSAAETSAIVPVSRFAHLDKPQKPLRPTGTNLVELVRRRETVRREATT